MFSVEPCSRRDDCEPRCSNVARSNCHTTRHKLWRASNCAHPLRNCDEWMQPGPSGTRWYRHPAMHHLADSVLDAFLVLCEAYIQQAPNDCGMLRPNCG